MARILFVEKQILDRAPVRALDFQFVDVAGWQVKAAQKEFEKHFQDFPREEFEKPKALKASV